MDSIAIIFLICLVCVAGVVAWHAVRIIMQRSPVKKSRPTVICLCGSTKFISAFRQLDAALTLAGNIVISIGVDMRNADAWRFTHLSTTELREVKAKLDQLHLHKIDISDEIWVINVNGYIGESTRHEINYALAHGKTVRYLEDPNDA